MNIEISQSIEFMGLDYPTSDEANKTLECGKFKTALNEAQAQPYVKKYCSDCPVKIECVPNLEQNFIDGICQNSTI